MDNIQFDESEYERPAAYQKGPSGLIGFVIKLGLAKDKIGAQKVLLVVIAICMLIMIVLWWSLNNGSPTLIPLPSNRV